MNEYARKKEAVRNEIEEYLNSMWMYRLEKVLEYTKQMYEEQEAGFKAADDQDSYGGGYSMLNGNFTNEWLTKNQDEKNTSSTSVQIPIGGT